MKKIFQATHCLSREELEQYAIGEVSKELKYKIENHLVDCPLCSEAMDGYMEMGDIQDDFFEDLYQEIDAKAASKVEPEPRKIIPWNRIAAGILFLLATTAAYLYYQSNQSTNNAYQAYLENQEASYAVRAIEEKRLPEGMRSGLKLYKEKNFQGSLSFFEDYIKENPESVEATYYAGMSALNIGEKEMAFDLLSVVRVNGDQLYEEATWLLSLLYLEKGEPENAKVYLEDLTKVENGFFVERAKSLLEDLE